MIFSPYLHDGCLHATKLYVNRIVFKMLMAVLIKFSNTLIVV